MRSPLLSPLRFWALTKHLPLGLAVVSFLCVCVCALLPSCITTAPTDGAYLERNPKAFGRTMGWEDAMAGRSQNYERHLRKLHPEADEEDFEEAYDDAYEAGEEEMEDFEDGRERERGDERERERGRGYPDERYSAPPPPSYEPEHKYKPSYGPGSGSAYDPIPGPSTGKSSGGGAGAGAGGVIVDHSYEAGHDVGKSDRRQGLSQDPRRHAGATSGPKDSTQAWIRGYEAGWSGR